MDVYGEISGGLEIGGATRCVVWGYEGRSRNACAEALFLRPEHRSHPRFRQPARNACAEALFLRPDIARHQELVSCRSQCLRGGFVSATLCWPDDRLAVRASQCLRRGLVSATIPVQRFGTCRPRLTMPARRLGFRDRSIGNESGEPITQCSPNTP